MKRILPLVTLLGCAAAQVPLTWPEGAEKLPERERPLITITYPGMYTGKHVLFAFADLQPPRGYDSVGVCDEEELLSLDKPINLRLSDLCYNIALFWREREPEYVMSLQEDVIKDLFRWQHDFYGYVPKDR